MVVVVVVAAVLVVLVVVPVLVVAAVHHVILLQVRSISSTIRWWYCQYCQGTSLQLASSSWITKTCCRLPCWRRSFRSRAERNRTSSRNKLLRWQFVLLFCGSGLEAGRNAITVVTMTPCF